MPSTRGRATERGSGDELWVDELRSVHVALAELLLVRRVLCAAEDLVQVVGRVDGADELIRQHRHCNGGRAGNGRRRNGGELRSFTRFPPTEAGLVADPPCVPISGEGRLD